MRNLSLFVTVALLGCAGLNPRLVDASVQKPSNVAVYFTVDTRSGEPVPGLTAEQFHIYYKSRFLGCVDFPLPNGKVLAIPKSTADLDVSEFAEYMEQVEADLAERDVYLDEVPA